MIYLTFGNPMYLWCLLSIPLIIITHFYLLKHSKAKALRFANFGVLKKITDKKLITKNITILVMRVCILLCMIIAVSETFLWYEGGVNENDFVIAVDVSPSMSAEDILPNRLSMAKHIAKWLINNSKFSNIGIISFSGVTFIDSVLINNKDSLRKIVDNIKIMETGGTDIAGAIITSTNLLLNSDKGKTIILISDGSNTLGAFIEKGIQKSIDYANNNHITIHSIGLGFETGPIGYLPTYYNISSVYNEDALKQISNSTQGQFFRVLGVDDFEQAHDNMMQVTKKGFVPINIGYGAIIIALLLLFVEWGLISTRFRKIP